MKALSFILVLIPTIIFADGGIAGSYRSIPAYIKDMDGKKSFRTIDTVCLTLFFDDSLRGHDKTKGGYWVTKYFYSQFEQPSKKHPAGRTIEKEIDIGDATPEEINTQNVWKHDDKIPKVYAKKIWVEPKLKGFMPGWSNPNRGAGYTLAFNFHFGSLERKVDIYGVDIAIGKRLFVIPHLFHIFARIGPSLMAEHWHNEGPERIMRSDGGGMVTRNTRHRLINSTLGLTANVGFQFQILKGVKLFTEAEFRSYGPLLASNTDASVIMVNKIPFIEKEIDDYVDEFDRHNGLETAKDLVNESLRFGIRFTF